MAKGEKKWGVTQVIVRYVSGDDTWELALDPKQIDALIFNWDRFKRINKVVGDPLGASNHVRPDGRPYRGEGTPDDVARRMGLKSAPRRVGPREEGTSEDPICLHNQNCTWWCLSETHDHGNGEEEPPPQ